MAKWARPADPFMFRATVFNVAGLQEFESFQSDTGYVEATHLDKQEAALEAVAKAIGIVEALDVYLVQGVIFAYDYPCGYVHEDQELVIPLQQSKRIDSAGIDAGWEATKPEGTHS